jgi:predicted nuclease of predicted toxin-antitoxin system
MVWKELKLTKDDRSVVKRDFNKKARFLVDEHVPPHVAAYLREEGWNVVTAQEAGLTGRPDDDLFAFAKSEDRLLLTNDRDFLNEQKHRSGSTGGVVVLPGGSGETTALIEGVVDMLQTIAPYWVPFRGSKIEFHAGRTLTMVP